MLKEARLGVRHVMHGPRACESPTDHGQRWPCGVCVCDRMVSYNLLKWMCGSTGSRCMRIHDGRGPSTNFIVNILEAISAKSCMTYPHGVVFAWNDPVLYMSHMSLSCGETSRSRLGTVRVKGFSCSKRAARWHVWTLVCTRKRACQGLLVDQACCVQQGARWRSHFWPVISPCTTVHLPRIICQAVLLQAAF
jgi:hypothetical protein